MSFWATSTGENVADNATNEFDAGGNFELIPDNSSVLAYVDEAGWAKDDNFNEYISIKWKVQKPEAVEGRVVFQKLWVKDPEPNALKKGAEKADQKRDKALRMLAAIDANAGGKLARKGTEPSDDELMLALANKPMVITVKTWEMDTKDGKKEGNWVAAVSPKTKELKLGKVAEKAAPAMAGGGYKDDDDSAIPF
jgi:hypothetical protein